MSHVFRECPGSEEVWSSLHYECVLSKQKLDNWNQITWLFKEASAEQCKVICYSLWSLWNARNKMIHENQWSRGVDIAMRFMALVEENQNTTNSSLTPSLGGSSKTQVPLSTETMCINFNAALNQLLFKSASKIVVRDCNAQVLASRSVIVDRITYPFTAEASTCVHAVRLRMSLGLLNVEVEEDSLEIIKKFQGSAIEKSKISGFIQKIQALKSNFNSIKFQFIPRQENLTAHLLVVESLKKGEVFYLL